MQSGAASSGKENASARIPDPDRFIIFIFIFIVVVIFIVVIFVIIFVVARQSVQRHGSVVVRIVELLDGPVILRLRFFPHVSDCHTLISCITFRTASGATRK